MLTSTNLNRCLSILSILNSSASREEKKLILEIGYVLKQELDIVNAWDDKVSKENIKNIDVRKLLEDNTQLCKENSQLMQINKKLQETIDHRIVDTNEKITALCTKIEHLKDILKET